MTWVISSDSFFTQLLHVFGQGIQRGLLHLQVIDTSMYSCASGHAAPAATTVFQHVVPGLRGQKQGRYRENHAPQKLGPRPRACKHHARNSMSTIMFTQIAIPNQASIRANPTSILHYVPQAPTHLPGIQDPLLTEL